MSVINPTPCMDHICSWVAQHVNTRSATFLQRELFSPAAKNRRITPRMYFKVGSVRHGVFSVSFIASRPFSTPADGFLYKISDFQKSDSIFGKNASARFACRPLHLGIIVSSLFGEDVRTCRHTFGLPISETTSCIAATFNMSANLCDGGFAHRCQYYTLLCVHCSEMCMQKIHDGSIEARHTCIHFCEMSADVVMESLRFIAHRLFDVFYLLP